MIYFRKSVSYHIYVHFQKFKLRYLLVVCLLSLCEDQSIYYFSKNEIINNLIKKVNTILLSKNKLKL